MISLNARTIRVPTLATFQSRHLFDLPVQLLDLPADSIRLLCSLRGLSSWIVGDDPIRAAGSHRDPEQLHPMVVRKAFDLDSLASAVFGRAPR